MGCDRTGLSRALIIGRLDRVFDPASYGPGEDIGMDGMNIKCNQACIKNDRCERANDICAQNVITHTRIIQNNPIVYSVLFKRNTNIK